MFSTEEWAALIGKLRQLTEAGKIEWASLGQSGLSVEVGSGIYKLLSRDNDGQPPWVLSVFQKGDGWNAQEILVDSMEGTYGNPNSLFPQSLIPGLRDIAFRMSLGGPQLAKDLLADMQEIDPTPPPEYGGSPF